MNVAINGAGVAGLQQARACQKRGISFHVYEAQDSVGGVWVNTELQGAQGENRSCSQACPPGPCMP
jgi:cation diffusion facilitator CzcD-associated flavoprotein CzcO